MSSLPNNKTYKLDQIENIYSLQNLMMMMSVFNWVKNIVGKRENADNHNSLLSLQCSQKPSLSNLGHKKYRLYCKGFLTRYQTSKF